MTAGAELKGDELIAKRHLPAHPERVWHAFTDPEIIAVFWGGSHATVDPESVTIDLRPGGVFELDSRGPDGRTRRLRFVYLTISAPYELVFDEPDTGIRTTISLSSARSGTDLTIDQRRLPPGLQTSQAADGLTSIADALAAHLRATDVATAPSQESGDS